MQGVQHATHILIISHDFEDAFREGDIGFEMVFEGAEQGHPCVVIKGTPSGCSVSASRRMPVSAVVPFLKREAMLAKV